MAKRKRRKSLRLGKKIIKKIKAAAPKALRLGAIGVALGVTFLFGLGVYYSLTLPDINQIAGTGQKASIVIEASDGTVLARYGGITGDRITAQDLPERVKIPFLAIEDRRFYEHHGIDPYGFARAMAANVMHLGFVQGGSTITQQLAKNLFLTPEKSINRKIAEAVMALWLERKYTKDEILTAYLNRVYFGAGAYGIDSAARTYFSKRASDLTLFESAVLAGLLKAPSRYSPSSNPELAKERAHVVLSAMEDAGYIDKKEHKRLKSTGQIKNTRSSSSDAARYFTDWILGELGGFVNLAGGDIVVRTTLNPVLESQIAGKLQASLDRDGAGLGVDQGAVVVLSNTGAVLSMVGGRDYTKSQFNRVTQAVRQAGSAFKPFVYLAALEQGFDPGTKIKDAPVVSGDYRPLNYDGTYKGDVTLTEALALSLNAATIGLLQQIGVDSLISVARRAGIYSTLNRELGLGLGTAELSPLELTNAYVSIANGGYPVEPYGILKITSRDGQVLYEHQSIIYAREFSRSVIYDLQDMMTHVVTDGTGRAADISGRRIAGKTGTTQDYRDAWFIGFSGDVICGVWMGNDDNTPMNKNTGGTLPARLWREIMVDVKTSGFGGFFSGGTERSGYNP